MVIFLLQHRHIIYVFGVEKSHQSSGCISFIIWASLHTCHFTSHCCFGIYVDNYANMICDNFVHEHAPLHAILLLEFVSCYEMHCIECNKLANMPTQICFFHVMLILLSLKLSAQLVISHWCYHHICISLEHGQWGRAPHVILSQGTMPHLCHPLFPLFFFLFISFFQHIPFQAESIYPFQASPVLDIPFMEICHFCLIPY